MLHVEYARQRSNPRSPGVGWSAFDVLVAFAIHPLPPPLPLLPSLYPCLSPLFSHTIPPIFSCLHNQQSQPTPPAASSFRPTQRMVLHPLLCVDNGADAGTYMPICGTHLLYDTARLPQPGTPATAAGAAATAAAGAAATASAVSGAAPPPTTTGRARLVGAYTQPRVSSLIPLYA